VLSIVYRILYNRVVKYYRLETCREIKYKHSILERLGQHPLIIKSFR
jgi:hypothetical protein